MCLLTAGSDEIVLLTRRPDLEQARARRRRRCATVVRREDARPFRELKAILEERSSAAPAIGIELRTFGLTADSTNLVRRRLEGVCELVDASQVIRTLRVVSRRLRSLTRASAAELADRSLEAMLAGRSLAHSKGYCCGRRSADPGRGGDPPPSGPVLLFVATAHCSCAAPPVFATFDSSIS